MDATLHPPKPTDFSRLFKFSFRVRRIMTSPQCAERRGGADLACRGAERDAGVPNRSALNIFVPGSASIYATHKLVAHHDQKP